MERELPTRLSDDESQVKWSQNSLAGRVASVREKISESSQSLFSLRSNELHANFTCFHALHTYYASTMAERLVPSLASLPAYRKQQLLLEL
jgi:hypothetical protein